MARLALGGCLGLLLTLAVASLATPAARAQDEGSAPPEDSVEALLRAFPDGLSGEQLDAVLAAMEPGAVRAALRERLLGEQRARRAAAAGAPPPEGPLELYMHRLRDVAAAYPAVPGALARAFARPGGREEPIRPLAFAGSVATILAAGLAAMLLDRRTLATPRRAVGPEASPLRRLAVEVLLDAAEVAAFVAGVLLAYALLSPRHPLAPAMLLVVLQAALVVLVAEMLARLAFEPGSQRPRLVAIPDGAARSVYRAVVGTVLLAALVAATGRLLGLMGVAPDPLAAVVLPLSLLPFAHLALLAWLRRDAVAAAVAGRLRLGAGERALLAAWPALATAYLLGLWLVVSWGVLTGQPGLAPKALASLALLLAAPLAAWLVQRPVARFYGLDESTAPDAATADPPAHDGRGHVQRLMRAVWAVLTALVVVGTAWLWGFDPQRHAGLAGLAVRLLFDAGVVLLLAYVAWALIARAIGERLEAARREKGSPRAQRVATLLPLLRRFLQVVLVAVVAMIVLSSLGVDIGPLIAGAGIVGLAIGLGAQQTIADILAGVFFLIEDAFHLGDYVEVGSLRGTVEGISLRSLKLRHHRGAVHTLPFGQVKSLTNHTRDWALVRLEFRVAPATDVGLVKRIVKGIGKELAADPEVGPGFIEPLKSQGIRNVEDGALVLGVKFIARPGTQFVIRREAYQRIVGAFEANGIELVGRGVVVRVEGAAGGVDGAVAGAAAAEAAKQAGR